MFAGLDFGTSLVKMAIGPASGDPRLEVNPYKFTVSDLLDPMAHLGVMTMLNMEGVTHVSVTGSRGASFVGVIEGMGFQVCTSKEDPVARELNLQAAGVRYLLAKEGIDSESFLLVSIGTGTSFTHVSTSGVRPYSPGLSVGGQTLVSLAGTCGVSPECIGEVAERGKDVDLLMKDIYPDAGFLSGEAVLASLGRLLEGGSRPSSENYCFGILKMVATLTMGHVMTIRNHPDWQWDGPIVFIGTPVSSYRPLRDTLRFFSMGLGLKSRFLRHGSFAGAIGAYRFAQHHANKAHDSSHCFSSPPTRGGLDLLNSFFKEHVQETGGAIYRTLRRRLSK